MTNIKREAGDKTKGFTLQKQRALALFFDEIKLNPDTHINVAIEYKGDVYRQNGQLRYIEEEKNYDSQTAFSFNSQQILNTLTYFLNIWIGENKSKNIKFGFYSTGKIAKESSTQKVKKLGISLPARGILTLITNGNYTEEHLLDSLKRYLVDEYYNQYKEDITNQIDNTSLTAFFNSISWYFEQDNEKDYKDEILNKIRESKFASWLKNDFHSEFVYAALMLKLEEKQDETDTLLKFLHRDNVENTFLKISTGQEISKKIYKYLDLTEFIGITPKPTNYIDRHLTSNDQNDYWAQFFERNTLLTVVKDHLKNDNVIQLILRASAGQGKSIELDNIAYEIRQLKLGIIPLKIYIKNYTSNLHLFISRKYPFWEDINKSQVMLLIDGVDELSPSSQQNFISDFNHLLESNTKLQIICTIRSNFDSNFFSRNKNPFEEYFLHPIFEKDVEDFINQHSQRTEELKKLIKKPWAKNIVSIPFYLTELVELSNETNKELPDNLRDFYMLIIKNRIKEDYYKYSKRLDKEEVFYTVQKIAIYMTLQGLNSIKVSKAKQISSFSKEDFKTIPFFSIYEDGLDNHLSFLHNNFQEFLAAEWLSKFSYNNISAIIFNDSTGYLNTKLLNTTVILFSILDKQSDIYSSLNSEIRLTDYTILFYVEKDRLPSSERLDIFKQFIIDGKEKGIAYLAGDFNEQDLLNFIDYDMDGFDFIIEELKKNRDSSNHFHSLLYLVSGFLKSKLTKRRTIILLSLMEEFIVMKGLKETEYDILLEIVNQLNKFNEDFVNNVLKKCPLITHRLVLTKAIELIHQNKIPDQFNYVISNVENISKNGSNWASNHERIFSKYVLDNLDYTNYLFLLRELSVDNNYLTHLLNVNEHFGDSSLKYIDRIYSKLAHLANENNSVEVINSFIDHLNEINYDSYSRNEYGDPLIFFNNLKQEDLFQFLLTNHKILKQGYIFNKLFNLEKTNRSREIIELYQQNSIDADRLKIVYCNTCNNNSSTSLSLSQFMSTEFPNEFGIITPLSILENQRDTWKKNGIKSLSNRKEYIKKIQQVTDYIKDNNPELINERGILDFGSVYHRHLDEQFENSIIIDFIYLKSSDNITEVIPVLLDDDESWFIYLGKQIKLYKYEELPEHLKAIKSSLQDYVNIKIETIDYLSYRHLEFDHNTIEMQIPIWFKEDIIDLTFETAIQFLCHDTIDQHTLNRVRMNDFLIEKYSLETIKPYLITIIEDPYAEHDTLLLAIRTCIDYEIKEVAEDIYEILYSSDKLRSICSVYLIRIGYDSNKLMRYLTENPFISQDWQMSVVEYLLRNEFNHSQLLEIIERQVEFDPSSEDLNYIARSISKYGLRLGSRKCMLLFFEYLKTKKYCDRNLQYSDFATVEHLFTDELFSLSLETLEIYKSSIKDHGRSDICGLLDTIITNLASKDKEKYDRTISNYNRLIQENIDKIPTIKSLEWWKIRLTKKFQETNSRYLTEGEVIDFIERTGLG